MEIVSGISIKIGGSGLINIMNFTENWRVIQYEKSINSYL